MTDASDTSNPGEGHRDADREIERAREAGESRLAEWLLLRPNRFSEQRSGYDALLIGILALLCLLPVGPLAVIRAVRCQDQRRDAGLAPSKAATIGATLGVIGTVLLVWTLARWLLD